MVDRPIAVSCRRLASSSLHRGDLPCHCKLVHNVNNQSDWHLRRSIAGGFSVLLPTHIEASYQLEQCRSAENIMSERERKRLKVDLVKTDRSLFDDKKQCLNDISAGADGSRKSSLRGICAVRGC